MKKILSILLLFALLLSSACAEELAQGSRGDSVATAQQALIDAGYLSGKADGIYGKNTARAVELFQYLNRLPQTGTIDETTLALLLSGTARTLRPALSGGTESEAVAELQAALIRYGFLNDEADGVYGKNTWNAVLNFQQHLIDQGIDETGISGVSATGEATGLTQEYLFSPTYSSYLHNVAPGAEGDPEVLRIERRLQNLGYMDAPPDDSYDDYAVACVLAFQQAENLNPDGIVTRAVADRLFSADAAAAGHWTPHTISLGDSGEAVRSAQQILLCNGFLPYIVDGDYGGITADAVAALHSYLTAQNHPQAALFSDANTLSVAAQELLLSGELFANPSALRSGDTGEPVLRVQRRLLSLYYLAHTRIDGEYGPKTASAISDFQAKNDLPETGVADEATLALLFSDNPVPDYTPYKMEIDTNRQRLHVYRLNSSNEYERIASFICSTGLNDTPTPKGIFLNTFALNRWHYFKKYECWAQYSYVVDGAIMIHSVLYDEEDENTLRMGSVYALGSKASHGCIRLKVEDAERIFKYCPSGTIVIVY